MSKFILILISIYLAYYAGNIIYDLFLKKNMIRAIDGNEEFSLVDFEEGNRDNLITVGIEDVEDLNTPKSFSKSDFDLDICLSYDREKLNFWRARFESEENIDAFESAATPEPAHEKWSETDKHTDFEKHHDEPKLHEEQIQSEQLRQKKVNNERWLTMLNAAETNVQMISNENGHKVYQSVAM